ncbi:MAG: GNAT family N-acetyltransferase [Cyclobacteriaceae bacterium]|nr:GNAT family N-acetyltransferase [Cyclobacteriaceae bacterium]
MNKLDLPVSFQSERLIFTRLRYEDAEEIFYSYASKLKCTKYLSWPTHQKITDTQQFLKYAIKAWNNGIDYSYSIRLQENNSLVGAYGIINENGKIQFGYVLSDQHWGKGYATEACKQVTLQLTKLKNIFRIGTYVDCEHEASCKVLEKSGFKREARLKNWLVFPNQGNLPKDCWVYILQD